MSELHDKARDLLERARGIGSGPTRKEWTDTIAALLAENEGLSMTNAWANSTLLGVEVRAEAAEAKLRELCEMEPVAWYDGNKFYANEESAICCCADMPKLSAVIPRPTMPESGK